MKRMEGRLERVRADIESIHLPEKRIRGIAIPSSFSARDQLFCLNPGCIDVGDGRSLTHPGIVVGVRDRIGITGNNGAGKSTLLRFIVQGLTAGGTSVGYLPQEVTSAESARILEEARTLGSGRLGFLMGIVSRLGSSPSGLLDSSEPSPGETRKLMLGLAILAEPQALVLDEPANHMDLESIRCIEEALSHCQCAMIIVSHDEVFLEKTTLRRWKMARHRGGNEYSLEVS
jgi:ATPase subunit of ABC transporter with duplicated ATPase domains